MPVVDEVIVNRPGFRPVLVDFQNGKIKPGQEKNLTSALYRRKIKEMVNRKKKKETIVSVTSSNMLYTGTVDDENDLYNNFILVHDKRSDKIRLIQVDCCTVSPLLDERKSLLDTSARISENSMSELKKQFGSKKSKKQTEQQERLKMNISTVKEHLEKTITDVKIDEADMTLTPDENDNLYRPKINRDASTREQVYILEDLVPKSVLDTLSEEALNILNSRDIEEYGLVPSVSISISQMLTSSFDDYMIQNVAILLYINYLIKFMSVPVNKITKKFVVCDKSTEVSTHILNNYTINTGNKWSRPTFMKDKASSFILVLAAIASDYEVNVEAFSKDLKIGIKKFMDISKVLGFSSTKNKSVVSLKLPLPNPVSTSFRRKRK